jgi:hypothetical protein
MSLGDKVALPLAKQLADLLIPSLIGALSDEQKAGLIDELTANLNYNNICLNEFVQIMEKFAVAEETVKIRSLVDAVKLWSECTREFMTERDEDMRKHPENYGLGGDDEDDEGDDDEPGEPEDPEPDEPGEGEGRVVDAEFEVIGKK